MTAVSPIAAQCSTQTINSSTFAATSAPFLATTSDQFITGVLCLAKCLPHRLPILFSFFPSPGRRRGKLGFFLQALFLCNSSGSCNEQCNATVKGDGGAVGLTNNPADLKRWVTAGPEIACLVSSFEYQLLLSHDRLKEHHEQIPSVHNAFTMDVDALVSAFEEAGNPFEDDGECPFALDAKDIVEEVSATTVQNKAGVSRSPPTLARSQH